MFALAQSVAPALDEKFVSFCWSQLYLSWTFGRPAALQVKSGAIGMFVGFAT